MKPEDAKLVQLHLFYKNDLPEGFRVGILEEYFVDNPEMEYVLTDASQMSINGFRKEPTDAARQEFIAGIQEQFAQCCQWMNQHKGQPMDEQWIACFVILLDDMTFLQSLDLFPNNEGLVQWLIMNKREMTQARAAIKRIYGIERPITDEEVYAEIENLRRRSDLDYKQERLAAALHLDLDNT